MLEILWALKERVIIRLLEFECLLRSPRVLLQSHALFFPLLLWNRLTVSRVTYAKRFCNSFVWLAKELNNFPRYNINELSRLLYTSKKSTLKSWLWRKGLEKMLQKIYIWAVIILWFFAPYQKILRAQRNQIKTHRFASPEKNLSFKFAMNILPLKFHDA